NRHTDGQDYRPSRPYLRIDFHSNSSLNGARMSFRLVVEPVRYRGARCLRRVIGLAGTPPVRDAWLDELDGVLRRIRVAHSVNQCLNRGAAQLIGRRFNGRVRQGEKSTEVFGEDTYDRELIRHSYAPVMKHRGQRSDRRVI